MSQGRIIPAKSLAGGLAWSRRAWTLAASISGVMLALSVAFYLYLAFVSYVIEKTGSAFRTGAESPLFQVLLEFSGAFDLCLAAFQVLAVLFFLRWIWLALTLARKLDRGSIRYAPLVAIAGFLVPVVNLWMPLFTMIDLDEFAASRETRSVPAIPWYPASILLSAILAFGLMRIVNDTPVDGFSDPGASQRLMQVAAIGAIAHMVLLLLTHGFMALVTPGLDLAVLELAEAQGAQPSETGDAAALTPRSADDFPDVNA